MKRQPILPALLGLVLCPAAWGGLVLGPQSKLWLEGDSTLHRYSSTAKFLHFSTQVSSASAGLEATIREGRVSGLRMAVPVAGLESGKAGLDGNLRRSLKEGQHSDIIFIMEGYRVEVGSATDKISTWGALTVAGARKPITLNASLSWRGGSALIDGEQVLLMTDFGIEPPKLMMGALRTDDKVVVKFHLELEEAAGQPPARADKEAL